MIARKIASPALVVMIYTGVFYALDRYDWGEAFVRFASLAILSALVLATRRLPTEMGSPGAKLVGVEGFLAVCFCLVALERGLSTASADFAKPPLVDIGTSTQVAVRQWILDGENPYR